MTAKYHFFHEEDSRKGIEIHTSIFQDIRDIFSQRKLSKLPPTAHAFENDSPFERAPQKIVNRIMETKKGMGRNLHSLFKKNIATDVELEQVLKEEQKVSGTTLLLAPFQNNGRDNEVGMFVVTTKGIAYILCDTSNIPSLEVAGLLGAGIKALIQIKGLNKGQMVIVKSLEEYPPSLVARCYPEGLFIPYNNINEVISSRRKNLLYMRFGDKYQKYMKFNSDTLAKVSAHLRDNT